MNQALSSIQVWSATAVALIVLALLLWGTVAVMRRKLRREPAGVLGWGIALFWMGVAGSIISQYKEEHKTPAEKAAEAREADRQKNQPQLDASIVQTVVTKVLRDPDSAKFGEISVYNDRKLNGYQVTFACGSVNAKNAFGGYTGSKDFVFVSDTLTVAIEGEVTNATFVKLWNTLCAGKHAY